MSERAAIPTGVAAMAALLCGIIASALQLTGGSSFAVGVVGCVVAGTAGALSVAGSAATGEDERRTVGVLRSLLAGATFAFGYTALLTFMRDGEIARGALLLGLAALSGVVLSRLSTREPAREHRRQRDTSPAMG